MEGASVDGYRAPLFVAWQLTNRCAARCLACCEESGPDKAWADELTRTEASALAQRIIDADIPYVAFGGGEPLGVPHCWALFELLADAGIALKIETDGHHIDASAADRLAALGVQCVQISVDGATAATHERVRPGSRFTAATGAIGRLTERGLSPELVFVPNRFNIHETVATYELAVALGCSAFVTGPMMRIGRAAADWERLACRDDAWEETVEALERRAASLDSGTKLSIYPWDILTEMQQRSREPPGHAAGGAQRPGEAAERASLCARRPAPRFHRTGLAGVSKRLAFTGGPRLRIGMPARPRPAPSRQPNLVHGRGSTHRLRAPGGTRAVGALVDRDQ